MPTMYQLIEAKKNGHALEADHIKWIIEEYTKKKYP
jgi:thymidine phosphorylase